MVLEGRLATVGVLGHVIDQFLTNRLRLLARGESIVDVDSASSGTVFTPVPPRMVLTQTVGPPQSGCPARWASTSLPKRSIERTTWAMA